MKKYLAVINGRKITTEKCVAIVSPITLKPYGEVSSLTKKEIDTAFTTARSQFAMWSALTLDARITYLDKWKEQMVANAAEIVELITYEVGKTKKDAQAELDRTIEYIDETFTEARKITTHIIGPDVTGIKNKTGHFFRVPKGVGVSISPFNYPINLAMSKIIPALVTGNTIVFKPATNGSLLGAFLGELTMGILPDGVFNVVTGRGSEIGDEIITNREIDFVSFTGSTRIGKRILDICPSKDVVLELGGKDPAIIVDATNLDYVADQIVLGGLSYSGQRCTAIKSIITTDAIADQLAPILVQKIEALQVGSPLDGAFIGPLISEGAAQFVQTLIDDAINKGGKVLTGNKVIDNLVYPTLIDNVTNTMQLFDEEPFGPLLPIIRVKNIDEAVMIANHSQYGLQASLFGENETELFELAQKINTGSVNINAKSQRGPDIFPFIGVRNSGFGVQGIVDALYSTTRIKGIVVNKR
jgi:glyceraldehyde-3-phosphate dehydrogenase (NADP+)